MADARSVASPISPGAWGPAVLGPVLLGAVAVGEAVAVARTGPWALAVLLYAAMLVLAVVSPGRAALVLLVTAIFIEPDAQDFTLPLSRALWQMPPGFEKAAGFTTSPMELMTMIAAVASLRLRPVRPRLPLLAWGIPAVLLLGAAVGLRHGGPPHLVYNEARGPILAVPIFVLTWRTLPRDPRQLVLPVMIAEALLACVVIVRQFVFLRGGLIDVPIDFAFTHEGSVILGIGCIIGVVVLLHGPRSLPRACLLVAYCGLLVFAMLASERRAATLVLIMGLVISGFALLPRRPVLVLAVAIPALLAGSAYLGLYWNKEYGTLAQPARAIRSQIDPSLRDDSSDQYRVTERFDVINTIRVNKVLGVGFGRPFIQFQPLPDLQSFWPLQHYTPHSNILWLWLKAGILGIGVVIGFFILLVQRCFRAVWYLRGSPWEPVAVVCLAAVAMFLIYSTVDLGFVGPRSIAPLAVVAALVLAAEPRSFAREQIDDQRGRPSPSEVGNAVH